MQENIPVFLEEKLLNEYGEELTKKIISGYKLPRKVTLRANLIKADEEEIANTLEKLNIKYKKVNFYNSAFIIENVDEQEIRKLDIYNEGKIYMQSLSSMLPPIILEPKEKENILDMTAAPGGKTTQMAAIANNKALITACEKNKIRCDRLEYNVNKQGAKCINIMREDARNLSDFFSFDKILLDAPCSGSGTLNILDNNLEKYFTEELINRSVKVQETLLKKALKILKSGGEMVYSTCSILKEENEYLLEKVLKNENAEIVPIDLKHFSELPILDTKVDGTLCIMPNELYEGFFVAKIKRK